MFTGEPDSTLSATGTVCDQNGNNGQDATTSPGFQEALAREQANLNDEVKDAKFWHVVQLGLHYKF